MTITKRRMAQSIVSENGGQLWLPANICVEDTDNLASPDIYAQSSRQLYPLGAKLEYADGRLFRYGKFGATSTSAPQARMVVNANACPCATGYEWTDGFEGNLYAAAAVGAEYVDLWTIIAASGTGIRTTVFAENFFEDGMLAMYPSGHLMEARICGSDVTTEVSATADYTRVYLDVALKTALAVGTAGAYITGSTPTNSSGGSGVTAYPSIYSQLKDGAAEGVAYVSSMGVFLGPTFTSAYFGWIQRRGRCIITPTAYFGDSANERMAQLHSDGCIALKAADGTHTIGYLTQRTVSGYGDLEVWLQLE